MRVRLHWATPVGPVENVRDFHLVHRGDQWKVVWDQAPPPNIPAQIVPVNYLRWDMVTGNAAGAEWGSRNVDSPHVRIVSMNAVDSAEGSVVMGEVVNEDTIPAFVNVNATLVDGAGNAIDDESSFDKILHILLPKQVSPYRIDFPNVSLGKVKNVRMDVKATLVPASSDPVIGVKPIRASEFGSRGEKMGLSCPTRNPRDFHCPSIHAVRSRTSIPSVVGPGSSTPAPVPPAPKKSTKAAPRNRPPRIASGDSNSNPTTLWRKVPPAPLGMGAMEANLGKS